MKVLSYSAKILLCLLTHLSFAHAAAPACQGTERTERFDDIVRIFMQQATTYIFLVRDSEGSFSLKETYAYPRANIKFFTDVPADKPMFAIRTVCDTGSFSPTKWYLEIHIHAVASIEGGGWTGKSGKTTTYGQTQVIE